MSILASTLVNLSRIFGPLPLEASIRVSEGLASAANVSPKLTLPDSVASNYATGPLKVEIDTRTAVFPALWDRANRPRPFDAEVRVEGGGPLPSRTKKAVPGMVLKGPDPDLDARMERCRQDGFDTAIDTIVTAFCAEEARIVPGTGAGVFHVDLLRIIQIIARQTTTFSTVRGLLEALISATNRIQNAETRVELAKANVFAVITTIHLPAFMDKSAKAILETERRRDGGGVRSKGHDDALEAFRTALLKTAMRPIVEMDHSIERAELLLDIAEELVRNRLHHQAASTLRSVASTAGHLTDSNARNQVGRRISEIRAQLEGHYPTPRLPDKGNTPAS